ncbi:MAG TPA: twin-arginine translocase subunit TatC [Candidatus Saccharimonadales bacterium]|nr:twin-arginine translocase subunit TatC [Candidatus Saccharimonadales bacterium]
MKRKKAKTNQAPSQTSPAEAAPAHNPRLTFMAHLMELRKRLFYIALSIVLWGAAAYFVQQKIVAILLRPAHNQQFIYTSVGGGIDFLFRVCIYTGIVFSIPVIVFQVLKYVQPLIKKDAVRFVAFGSVVSGVLAAAGMVFGYFLGLPAALHFLLHQFTTAQIHALLTIQSYMSFVTLYMLGSALLFQLPLILVLINRIKPLKPKKLFHYERWVVLFAFVAGGIMNPSPRVQDQLLLAGPMVAAYQIGILLVWLANRRSAPARKRDELRQKDAQQQALRQERFQQAQVALQQQLAAQPRPAAPVAAAVAAPRPAVVATAAPLSATASIATTPKPHTAAPKPAAQPTQSSARPVRRRYFNDFSTRRVAAPAPPRTLRIQQDSAEAAS